MQYFLVEVSASVKYPELLGREALIQVDRAQVLVAGGTVSTKLLEAAYEKLNTVVIDLFGAKPANPTTTQ